MKTPASPIGSPILETLEPRIAPAGLNESAISAAVAGSSILLGPGQGLGSSGPFAGSYYLYVEKGQALVFTTDLNGNGSVDHDEITGVSAGDGLRLTSFVDIHGDIVTNLLPGGLLTDSDGDSSNGRDGKIVLNSRIESITLRSVVAADLNASVEGNTPLNRLALSNYSIYGNVFAGGGLGFGGNGLLIDTAGFSAQQEKYILANRWYGGLTPTPSLGHFFTGTAVSGQAFSFGTSPLVGAGPGQSLRGDLAAFIPAAGQAGGDLIGIKAGSGIYSSTEFEPAVFFIGGIQTGDGGFGAKGGDIRDVYLNGDVGGFRAIAGDGGDGVSGGNGGSIINFGVTASPNSVVSLFTGDGGQGLLGNAGQAGLFKPNAPIEIYGDVRVGLGRGGDGLANAGAGTSLDAAKFQLFSVGEPAPSAFLTTTREAGDLGSFRSFDFDADGNSDAVFLTQTTQQMAVAFGNGAGGFRQGFMILEPSLYAEDAVRMSPLAVADFNGDGLPDIATASSQGSTFGGVKSFLNRGFDGAGDWLGFDIPRYSPTPFGDSGVNTNLTSGDFNDDGIVDLALINVAEPQISSDPYPASLVVLSGLTDSAGIPDGFFAADFGLGSGSVPTKFPIALAASFKGQEVALTLKATAIESGDNRSDILAVLTRPDGDTPSTFQTFSFDPSIAFPNGSLQNLSTIAGIKFNPRKVAEVDVGGVKINKLFYEKAENISAYDFAIADANGDGFFDPVVFGQYGDFTVASVLDGSNGDGTVAQVVLTDARAASPVADPSPTTYYGIAVTAPKAAAGTPQIPLVVAGVFEVNKVSRAFEIAGGQVAFAAQVGEKNDPIIRQFDVVGFDQYGPTDASDGALSSPVSFTGYATSGAENSRYALSGPFEGGFSGLTAPANGLPWNLYGYELISSDLILVAGDGGFSYLGNGGHGGNLGQGVATKNSEGIMTGALEVAGFNSTTFLSGSGGGGFLSGGRAGGLFGIFTEGVTRTLTTQNGGSGLLGSGGAGGSISGIFFEGVNTKTELSNLTLVTGDGGFGARGGNGGFVLGKGDVKIPDVKVNGLDIVTGSGGFGTLAGGSGGFIGNFKNQAGTVNGGWIGPASLSFATGFGGGSSAGAAGHGGDISNSGPTADYNVLIGQVALSTGSGGSGLTGGHGGSISGFVNRVTGIGTPFTATVTTGDGGDGVLGDGGRGGHVSGSEITASSELIPVLAGDGGLSAAAKGGAGGALSQSVFVADTGSLVFAAGAGGNGFLAGGGGGQISSVTLNASALDNGRVVAIAGDGGHASAVSASQIQKENPPPPGADPLVWSLFQQIWAMGSSNGRGGAGGGISSLTQPNSIQVSTDLIAGNGGNTLNYGLTSDAATGAGAGGSLKAIKLAGDAGIIAAATPIRSYVPFGSPMAVFTSDIRTGAVTALSPATGNVGVLAGASGLVRGGEPASAGVAGSITGFEARNILSMVAGSVDRIAAITSVSGVSVPAGGKIGVFKATDANDVPIVHVNNRAYYSGPNYSGAIQGVASPYLGGGSLVDGAVLTYAYSGSAPERLFDL